METQEEIPLTNAQQEALLRIRQRFPDSKAPALIIGCAPAIAVDTGTGLWIAIESDGYAHT